MLKKHKEYVIFLLIADVAVLDVNYEFASRRTPRLIMRSPNPIELLAHPHHEKKQKGENETQNRIQRTS